MHFLARINRKNTRRDFSRTVAIGERSALFDELIGKTHETRFRSLARPSVRLFARSLVLSGSESAWLSARIVYRKPRFRHQSCTRLYYFVIDILPVREKGTEFSRARERATQRRCNVFISHQDFIREHEFPFNAGAHI